MLSVVLLLSFAISPFYYKTYLFFVTPKRDSTNPIIGFVLSLFGPSSLALHNFL